MQTLADDALKRAAPSLANLDRLVTRWMNGLMLYFRPDILRPNPPNAHVNLDPLLINTAGSWANRPGWETPIDNLVLAGDYIRTSTDLATMEGANEAGRRAVNCILERAGSKEQPCE